MALVLARDDYHVDDNLARSRRCCPAWTVAYQPHMHPFIDLTGRVTVVKLR